MGLAKLSHHPRVRAGRVVAASHQNRIHREKKEAAYSLHEDYGLLLQLE